MDNNISCEITDKQKHDSTFIVTCVIYLIVLLCFIALRIAGGLGWFDKLTEEASDIVFSVLSQIVIMFLIPILGVTLCKKKGSKITFKEWGFGKTSFKIIAFAVLLGFLLFFFNIFVAGIFNSILSIFGYRFPNTGDSAFTGVGGLFVSFILIAVLPGMCEETAHRGLLLRGFAGKLGIIRAVLLSSLIFGLMHLNIVQFFYAAILGYIIALAVLATRSIWTGVIMHFMNNAIGTYFSFAGKNGWALGDVLYNVLDFINGFGFIFFLAFFFGIYCAIFAIINKFARDNFVADRKKEFPDFVLQKRPTLFGGPTFYLKSNNRPIPLTPMEKTFLFGIIFLGSIVTTFTLVWGFL